jgi:ABC-type dipeptide/oligopeptide/nickel transport system ATPase component
VTDDDGRGRHELRFAHHVASSILMMDEGQVIEEAPPDRFFSAPSQERTRRFLRWWSEPQRSLFQTRRNPSRFKPYGEKTS